MNVQNFLKSKRIDITEKKTSLSSENITEFVIGTYTVRIVYKPMSGGMTETTLNSTITELVPCLAWLNGLENPDFTGNINWNFEKFMIDEKGNLIHRYRSRTSPMDEEITRVL